MVAGTGRFCTEAMEGAPEPLIVKTGAEGVFVAGLPERGIGIALKIDDGAKRASEAAMRAFGGKRRNRSRSATGRESRPGRSEPPPNSSPRWTVCGVPPRADLC